MKDKKIVVLMGGPSKEAEISRRTGAGIASALEEAGYNVSTLELVPDQVIQDITKMNGDVVFNAVHGKYGEDGALSGMLEMARIPYTGSGVMAHAVGMNKKISKYIFKGAGIPTASYEVYNGNTMSKESICQSIMDTFTIPVVLKPSTQGSSIGVTIVREEAALPKAVEEALQYDAVLVVETYLDGDEFTVGVLDGKAMPVIQICPHSGEYDYKSKYTAGQTDYLVPAPISEELAATMQTIAEQVYTVLQCEGVARVDMMTDADGNVYVLEINTVPGMTATSLVPKAAKVMGLSFSALCERILESAGLDKE